MPTATAISMPRLGMTMEEGTVVAWPVAEGSPVEKGRVVLVIESEKSEVEIEAPVSGVLRHVYVEPGETVPCGTLLGAITAGVDDPFDPAAFHAAKNRPQAPRTTATVRLDVGTKTPAERAGAAAGGPIPPPARGAAARRPIAPAARAAARKLLIDPERVPGTGPGGRVTREDVIAFAAAREALVPVGDGVALEVRVAGDGDPLLLLPGLGSDVSSFARQIPVLARRFRVHGVNPRGVSLSEAPDAEATLVTQLAGDAAAAVPGALHLVGASLGAAAALELALAQPERVRTLTLITPFVTASPRLLAVAAAWVRLAEETSRETLAAALLPWLFGSASLADEAARRRAQRGLEQSVARVPAKTLARMLEGLRRWSGTRAGDLADVRAPTLVVAAGEDLLTPDAAAIAEAIPDARLLRVPSAGHAVALEAPDAVNEALLAHLSRSPTRDASR